LEVVTYRGKSGFSNDTDVMPYESVVFLTKKKTKNMFSETELSFTMLEKYMVRRL
jgi:hypothetical protein